MNNFSPSSERNKDPILEKLKTHLQNSSSVLEIGSGSGQHAIHFTKHLKHLDWQCSELPDFLNALNDNISSFSEHRFTKAIALNVTDETAWRSLSSIDCLYTANTLHIMSWQSVIALFNNLKHLPNLNTLAIYGPFKYQGKFTSASNQEFDLWLKARDKNSGIRNIEDIEKVAQKAGFSLQVDHTMPANNQLLIWKKV